MGILDSPNLSLQKLASQLGITTAGKSQDQLAKQLSVRLSGAARNAFRTPIFSTILSPAPTITLSAANATTAITGSVKVPSSLSGVTTINQVFRYLGGAVLRSDYNASTQTYAVTFPAYDYVKRVNVTTTNDFGSVCPEFMFDGQKMEIGELGEQQLIRVWVDNVPGVWSAVAPLDGSTYLRLVDFGTRAIRRVRIEISGGVFGGVRIGANDTVWAVDAPVGPRLIALGDSFSEGTGSSTGVWGSYAEVIGRLTGFDVWPSGSGQTGYVAPGSTGRVKYQDRAQSDVIAYAPDVVLIQGSTNDYSLGATLQAAATSLYAALRAGLPNAVIIILGICPVTAGNQDATSTANQAKLKAAAQGAGFPFIDPIAGATYDGAGNLLGQATGAWFTGNGNIGATQATGNASYYTFTDNGHPSGPGHEYLGRRVAYELQKLLPY